MGKKKKCILLTPNVNGSSGISEISINNSYLTDKMNFIDGKDPLTYWTNPMPYFNNYNKISDFIGSSEIQWAFVPYHKKLYPNLIIIFKRYRSWAPRDIAEYTIKNIVNRTATYITKSHKIHGNAILYDTKKNMTLKYFNEIKKNSKIDSSGKEFKKYQKEDFIKTNIGKDNKKCTFDIINNTIDNIKDRDIIRKDYIKFLQNKYIFTLEDINILNTLIYNVYVLEGKNFYQVFEYNNFTEESKDMRIVQLMNNTYNKSSDYLWKPPKLIKTEGYDKLMVDQIKIMRKYNISDFGIAIKIDS
jgi:hypothetical protein